MSRPYESMETHLLLESRLIAVVAKRGLVPRSVDEVTYWTRPMAGVTAGSTHSLLRHRSAITLFIDTSKRVMRVVARASVPLARENRLLALLRAL